MAQPIKLIYVYGTFWCNMTGTFLLQHHKIDLSPGRFNTGTSHATTVGPPPPRMSDTAAQPSPREASLATIPVPIPGTVR